VVFEEVDWSKRGRYMRERHGVDPLWADQALADPNRVVLDPDPASKSGQGIRIIGHSRSVGRVLTVIVLEYDGVEYGVNGWWANDIDQRRYREGRA
jgi:hypothetical protein